MEAMQYYERFGLVINNKVIKTPLAIASMAGCVDAGYVLKRAAHIGAAFIGGYSIDQPTMDAGREMAAAGRTEFIYDDPLEELKNRLPPRHGRYPVRSEPEREHPGGLCRNRRFYRGLCSVRDRCSLPAGADDPGWLRGVFFKEPRGARRHHRGPEITRCYCFGQDEGRSGS